MLKPVSEKPEFSILYFSLWIVGSTGYRNRKLSTAFGPEVSLRFPVLWHGRSAVATTAQPDTVWLQALVRSLVRIFVFVLVFRACRPVLCRSFCPLRLCQMLSLRSCGSCHH